MVLISRHPRKLWGLPDHTKVMALILSRKPKALAKNPAQFHTSSCMCSIHTSHQNRGKFCVRSMRFFTTMRLFCNNTTGAMGPCQGSQAMHGILFEKIPSKVCIKSKPSLKTRGTSSPVIYCQSKETGWGEMYISYINCIYVCTMKIIIHVYQ